jgi:hypothetical protein
MFQNQRAQALFFARLASIPTPTENMSEGEKLRFLNRIERESEKARKGKRLLSREWNRVQRQERARESGLDSLSERERKSLDTQFLDLSSYVRHNFKQIAERQRTQVGTRQMQREWAQLIVDTELPRLHETVRHCLLALFDDMPVIVQRLFDAGAWAIEPFTRWRLVDGELHEQLVGVDPHEHSAGDFVALLRQKPFPFGRCGVCGAFFVRVRRQRYCSRKCTAHGVEAARRGTRKEYMRRYMAMRRAKERKAQRKGD